MEYTTTFDADGLVRDDRGEVVRARTPVDGKFCTEAHVPDEQTLAEAIRTFTDDNGIWAWHSDAPAPAWVASTDLALAQVLAAVWGCPVRDPEPGV